MRTAALICQADVVGASARHIPALDGLRATAIATVVIGHLIDRGVSDGAAARVLGPIPFWGVGLFFAISGFLITRLLLAERERLGRISLPLFYARRVVRLWPALWVFLIGCIVLHAAGLVPLTVRDVLSPLFFISDYILTDDSTTFHTWSLSVEEQFYLLWPVLLIILAAAKAWRVLVVAVVAAPLVRLATYVLIPAWRGLDDYQFHQRYDVLALGCLLAIAWDRPWFERFRNRRARLVAVAGIALVALMSVGDSYLGGGFKLVVGDSLQSVAFVAIVAGAVTAAPRVLEYRWVRHIGAISFSLYLWQQVFTLQRIGWLANPLLGVITAVVLAELSYRFVERPFDGLRRRLTPRAD